MLPILDRLAAFAPAAAAAAAAAAPRGGFGDRPEVPGAVIVRRDESWRERGILEEEVRPRIGGLH